MYEGLVYNLVNNGEESRRRGNACDLY